MKINIQNLPASRRGFLQSLLTISAISALSTFLEACSRIGLSLPTPASMEGANNIMPGKTEPLKATPFTQIAPTESTEAPMTTPLQSKVPGISRVAFVKTDDRTSGVRKAIDLLNINPVQDKTVLLKPNFNSADPNPGSTHPDTLRSLIMILKEMGAATITLGDRSGMGNTRSVMEKLGVFDLAGELDFDVIVFDELTAEDWIPFNLPGSHWKQGFPFARPCLEAGAIVQTCCLKTHQYGGHFTLSLKNSVGMAGKHIPGNPHNFMDELHSSKHQRKMIAEINAAYTPALVILDGIEAFTEGGPAQGSLVKSGVILAGTDRVAIDAVGVALLRYFGTTKDVERGPVFNQEQIARAVELGLGVDSPGKIEMLTPDAESAAFAAEIRGILAGE